MNDRILDLVDIKEGTVSPTIYTDPTLYELELERVFGRCWLFVDHESQTPEPSDFIASYMGADRVLVVRQDYRSVAAS